MRQSSGLLDVALSLYTPLIDLYVAMDDLEAAKDALATASSLLNPPVDKFLAFSAAHIQAAENDIDAAHVSLQQARDVIDQFQLKFLEVQVQMIQGIISEAEGDFAAMAEHYLEAIERIEGSVVGADIRIAVPQLYAEAAIAQIKTGSLDAAEHSVEAGFQLDPSEPLLWVARARLQQARDMPQMALASVNYALAIWKDADENYKKAKKARLLAAELQSQ